MINIENFEKLDQPYPIAIVDDFFNDNDLNKITNEFPSYDDFTKFKKTMVNRHILSNENPEFYKFIEINKSWVKFYEIINSHNFFLRILKILTGNNSYEYKKFLELNFNKEFNQKKIKIFTDDPFSVFAIKDLALQYNFKVDENNNDNDLDDFIEVVCSSTVVMFNSSFCWWATTIGDRLLEDKVVFYPKGWIKGFNDCLKDKNWNIFNSYEK